MTHSPPIRVAGQSIRIFYNKELDLGSAVSNINKDCMIKRRLMEDLKPWFGDGKPEVIGLNP